jgi:CheY-specific phosphatase CheX
MSEAKVPAVPPAEVVDAFQSAALTVLQELTQIEALPEQVSLALGSMPSGEVVLAAIRLLRQRPGTFTLVLTTDTASQLAARYLPEGTQLTEEMIDDVAGEFANVIAGQAKTILKGTLYHFTMSTPVVTRPERLTPSPVLASQPLSPAPHPGEGPGRGVVKPLLVTSLTSEVGRVVLLLDLPPCPNA